MVTPLLPLTVRGAGVRRRGKQLVGPVNLDLTGNGITVVMGPNGAGKTTLLRMLHGLAQLSDGSIEWNVPLAEAHTAVVGTANALMGKAPPKPSTQLLDMRFSNQLIVVHEDAVDKVVLWHFTVHLSSRVRRRFVMCCIHPRSCESWSPEMCVFSFSGCAFSFA